MRIEDIDAMLTEGVPFELIEDRIEQASLPQDVKSVLWLCAWVEADIEQRRHVIREMLLALGD